MHVTYSYAIWFPASSKRAPRGYQITLNPEVTNTVGKTAGPHAEKCTYYCCSSVHLPSGITASS